MPKVSIITPLYNGSKTLLETAESVLSQDYRDWEWILMDDGSKDETQEIARSISQKNSDRVFYFEHASNKNFGTSYTRNRAVEKSKGEILAFIDQDDIWNNNRLSHQLHIFEKLTDCAMIWSPALYWYKDRSFVQPVKYHGKDLNVGIYEPPEFIEIFLHELKGTPLPSASLVLKKSFNEVNGYEESIKGSEDIVLWLKLARKFKIYFDSEVLIKYRKHQDSTLRRANLKGEMDEWNLTFYKWVIEFLKNNSGSKKLINENEFAYYIILKKIAGKENYLRSRKKLLEGLNAYPPIKKKFMKDYLLDLLLPFNVASKISAKLRFDMFENS